MEESGIKIFIVVAMMISASVALAEVDETTPAVYPCEICSFSPEDMGMSDASGHSSLWILDPSGDRCSDLSLPLGTIAELEASPGDSSYLMLYHRLPSGNIQTEYLGYLYKGHKYRLRFCSSLAGTHEIWFRAGWQESNRARVYLVDSTCFH